MEDGQDDHVTSLRTCADCGVLAIGTCLECNDPKCLSHMEDSRAKRCTDCSERESQEQVRLAQVEAAAARERQRLEADDLKRRMALWTGSEVASRALTARLPFDVYTSHRAKTAFWRDYEDVRVSGCQRRVVPPPAVPHRHRR